MSYDIYIRSKHFCPHCGRDATREEETYSRLPDPTYNLTPIFDLALTGEPLPNPEISEAAVVLTRAPTARVRGLRVLSGRKVGDSIVMIEAALLRIATDREPFLKLEPTNKWGDLRGAVEVLENLLMAAKKCDPDAVWDIH